MCLPCFRQDLELRGLSINALHVKDDQLQLLMHAWLHRRSQLHEAVTPLTLDL